MTTTISVVTAGVTSQLTTEVQTLVRRMYQDGQTTLQKKEPVSSQKTDRHAANRLTHTIHSNVACMQLLLWAVQDESGSFQLLSWAVQGESGSLQLLLWAVQGESGSFVIVQLLQQSL